MNVVGALGMRLICVEANPAWCDGDKTRVQAPIIYMLVHLLHSQNCHFVVPEKVGYKVGKL
jgi:hypothetical protein